MVARGDLGMDIPPQKVPLAQKLMIAKANIAGKFVICATQMMESMITARYPTRAEITDVANAVFDGADAVMLSGETANGVSPQIAVAVMASITQYAEIGVNNNQTFNFIRSFTPKPVGMVEAAVSTMAKNAVDIKPGMMVVFSESGKMARLVAKYRPCAPVLVVTSNAQLARSCSAYYSCYPMLLAAPLANKTAIFSTLKQSLRFGVEQGLCVPGKEVVVLASTAVTASGVGKGTERELFVTIAPGKLQFHMLGTLAPNVGGRVDDAWVAKTITMRSACLDLNMILRESKVCTQTFSFLRAQQHWLVEVTCEEVLSRHC
jgi:pyruvate kinase